MTLKDLKLAVNDSLPSRQFTVTRSNSTVPNLSGFTANLKVREKGSTTNSFTLAITSGATAQGQITNPTGGIIRFDFSTDLFSSSGTFIGEISFSSSNKDETAEDCQSFIVRGEF